jgi:hypothetical protein
MATAFVSDLALAAVPGGMAASWSTWKWLSSESNVVEWARVNAPAFESSGRTTVIDSGSATYPFEFFAAGPHLVWLYHAEPFGSAVSFALAANDRVSRGSLTILFRARAIWSCSRPTIHLHDEARRAAEEPMMASWMTELNSLPEFGAAVVPHPGGAMRDRWFRVVVTIATSATIACGDAAVDPVTAPELAAKPATPVAAQFPYIWDFATYEIPTNALGMQIAASPRFEDDYLTFVACPA